MPIILDKVSHIYGEDTTMAVKALDKSIQFLHVFLLVSQHQQYEPC